MIEHIRLNNLDECQRLFHGRGHAYEGLSHVNVDWLPPVVLITVYQEVEETWLAENALQLKNLVTECKSVQVQYRSRKMAPTEVLIGEEISDTEVLESGLKYKISLALRLQRVLEN